MSGAPGMSDSFKTPGAGRRKLGAMPINAKCDALSIVVTDMARTLDFYRALGLDIPEGAEKEPHVGVDVTEGFSLMFDPVTTIHAFDEGWQPASGGPNISLAFGFDTPAEVDEAYATLTGLGHDGHKEPWDAFWGQRYAMLRDPEGNGVDLYAPLE
jgi:catechol 2,3-dioxygenase-like lactoylglutathione lyase family enzyme